MYIKVDTESFDHDETFRKLVVDFTAAKKALTEYLNEKMDFALDGNKKSEE